MQTSIHGDEERLTGEFIDRRRHLRRRLLSFLLSLVLMWGVLLLPMDWWIPGSRISAVLVFLYLGYTLWWFWKNWRCPACDEWLGGWRTGVNPWFSSPPLRCPHCGEKLLM
ncbi:MAG: hypothetical protein ACM3QS_17920 [Bacteroidota bacterium]